MRRFLLFVFGVVPDEIILETLADLENVSSDIRFFSGSDYGIYHFQSKQDIGGIHDLILEYLDGMTESFFIFPLDGEHTVEMDDELKSHFLEGKMGDFDDETDPSLFSGLEKGEIMPIKDLLSKYLEELPEKKLSVDEILDKINKEGVESLSKREKDFLDNQDKL
tara:strand:- start:5188 stop:5682 length:495 start_codon:yes stop_codon:yes gene_type:complete